MIAYERATKIEPKFKEAWANLAQAYRDNGDRSNAEIYFQKALSVDASYVHGYHLRGLLYYGCGEIRLALADFKRGCEVDPSDRNCQLMHCVCLHSLGQVPHARDTHTHMHVCACGRTPVSRVLRCMCVARSALCVAADAPQGSVCIVSVTAVVLSVCVSA